MIYRVVLDGVDILDYSSKDLSLISPVLELEVNNAGSLEFVMPPNHTYYDDVHILTSTIEVYEDDTLIWFGRPVDETIDFYKQKKIYCEGPFSFLNDTIQRPEKYESVSIHKFFKDVIKSHNSQITNKNRKFEVGQITVKNTYGYRKLNYESSHDVIQNMCLDTNDGYLFFRRENGTNYVDWFAEMPFSCNQSIEFGVNLLNYRSNFSGGDFATCVLPLGKTQRETGEPLTIKSVNNGSDILQSVAAVTYGNIIKVQNYSDIDDATQLREEGEKFLNNSQFNSLVIECSAADLHSIIPQKNNFQVGQTIHCVSEPHLIDRDFPISKMTINLDSAAKVITLGILKKKTLTRIYKEDTESTDSASSNIGNNGIIEDPNGDLWEILGPIDPSNPEDSIKRMPTHIEVSKAPNKDTYYLGETIDYSGISVNIWCEDKIWTNPPRYNDGKAPFAELSFPQTKILTSYDDSDNVGDSFHIFVPVVWYYKGEKYQTTTILTVINQTNGNTGTDSGVSSVFKIGNIEVPYQYGGKVSFTVDQTGRQSNVENSIIAESIDRDYSCQPDCCIVAFKYTSDSTIKIYFVSKSQNIYMHLRTFSYYRNGQYDVDKVSTFDPTHSSFSDYNLTPGHSTVQTVTLHGTKIYYRNVIVRYAPYTSNSNPNQTQGLVINMGTYSGPSIIEHSYTYDWFNEMLYQLVNKNDNMYGAGIR